MKKKKIAIIAAVAAVVVIALSVGLFMIFHNALASTEETVILGEVYEAASSISDKKGNEYAVDFVEVYRIADGKQQPLIYGTFDILDVLGYKLVYTATGNDKTVTQEHYLRVNDHGKPIISIEQKNIAEVGVKYTFPKITVKDLSKEEIPYGIEVYRSGETPEKTESEKDGFVPKEHGYYELHISAEDSSGNKAEAVYMVYARRPRYATELDALDDEGIFATVYSKSGTKKEQAGFSFFGRLATSYGSAYFQAGTGETTGFYLAPRNEYTIMNQVGDDGYVSAWIYISTLKNSTKTIKCATNEFTVATNEWQEIRLTKEEVGQWPNFFNKLSAGEQPLFEVVNDGEDYAVFVDDVFAVKNNAISVNGLKDSYASGETISVTAEGAADAQYDYYYAGKAYAFEGSFVPEMDGEYRINVYDKDRTAFASKMVSVGSMRVSVKDTEWYVLGQEFKVPGVSVTNGGANVSSQTWMVDMETGERTLLGDTFIPEKKIIGLYTECSANGKKSALFRVISCHEKEFGAWYDTDDPACAEKGWSWDNLTLRWLEELDGEKGVLEVNNETGEEGYFNNREFWTAFYSKEHYKRCSRLVFKMKSTASARLDYIAEPSWTQLSVTEDISTGDWVEYSVDFKDIYEHFEEFSTVYQFHTAGSQPYTFYIADIRAVTDDKLEDVSIKQGDTYDISTHASLEGCQITECRVSYQGSSVRLNHLSFTAGEAGQYTVVVKGYDHVGLFFENTFHVNAYAPGVWTDFLDGKCSDIWTSAGVKTSWMQSHDGAEGVFRLDLDAGVGENTKYVGNTGGINWPAVFSSAGDYKGANRLVFRVKIEGTASNALEIYNPGETKTFGKVFESQGATDGWQEFMINVDVEKNYDDLNGMHFVFWTNGKSTIYIDKITAIYEPEPEADSNVWTGFDSAASANVWSSAGVKKTWLESYEGRNSVFRLELNSAEGDNTKYVGNTDGVNWAPVCKNAADYKGATGLIFRVKIEGDASNALQIYGPGERTTFGKVFDSQGATDGWQEFLLKVNVEENYEELKGMHFVFWTSRKATIYIDEIRVSYEKEPEPDRNVWTGFDSAADVNVWSSTGVKKTWLESYEGRNSVFRLELNSAEGDNTKYVGNTDGVNWTPVCKNAADYHGATGLIFRMKIEGDASNALQVFGPGEKTAFGKVFDSQGATDGWQEFLLKVNVEENYEGLKGMHFVFWTSGKSTIYLDEIRVSYEEEPEQPTPVTDPTVWNSFDNADCIKPWGYGSAQRTWLENYDGAEGVMKVDLKYPDEGNTKFVGATEGAVNWPAAGKASDYHGATGLIFRVKIEGDASNALTVYGHDGDWKEYGRVFDGQGATDGWQEFVLKVDVEAEYENLTKMFWAFWVNDNSTIYLDLIRVSYEEEEPNPPTPVTDPNVWTRFDSSDCAGIWTPDGATASWVSDMEGANDGVLKLELKGEGAKFIGNTGGAVNWAPVCKNATDYQGATGLIFRVKIEGNASNALTVLGHDGDWIIYGKVYDGQGVTDGWQEFLLKVDVEKEYENLTKMFLGPWASGDTVIYLDEIRVSYEKEPEPEENYTLWNGFDNDDCIKPWGWDSAQRTWLENYDGAEGVMKVDLSGEAYVGADGDAVNWPAAGSKASDYHGAKGLIFRVKIEGEATNNHLEIFGYDGTNVVGYGTVFTGQGATDGWQEFVLNVDVEKEYESLTRMWWRFWVGTNSTIYLDEIRAFYPQENWNSFDNADCVNMWGWDSAQRTWLESYDGAEGVMKVDLSGEAYVGADGTAVNWPAAGSKASDYHGAKGLIFRVKIEGEATNNHLEIFGYDGTNVVGYGTVFTGQGATDGWQEFVLNVDVEKEYESLTRMWWRFWVGTNSTIYLDEIRAFYPQENWNSFDSEDCVNMWGWDSAQRTWLESYDGAEGVMKVDLSGEAYVGADGTAVNWPAAGSKASDYHGATGLAFRVKIEGEGTNNHLEIFGHDGENVVGYGTVFTGQGVTDGWQEFVLNVDVEKEYESLTRMWWRFWVGTNSTIYLDGIRAVYE